MTALLVVAVVLIAGTAEAHHTAAHSLSLTATWTFDPRVLVPLGLSGSLYVVGSWRLWRRSGPAARTARAWQATCFWFGWVALVLALVSPLHWLGERLFTAHMIEHEMLMVVAAPLLVLARPAGAMMWAFPYRWRAPMGAMGRAPSFAAAWRFLTEPLVATVLHGVALWAWHMPALYNAVLANDAIHWLQHVSFLATALLFWWSLLHGRARERGYGAAVFYLFVTGLHTGLLGILLTISRYLWYPTQTVFGTAWGLTPLEDQQLAGLVMWVPAGLVYAGAALALAGIWISRTGAGLRGEARV
jgi:cytochrome c oxidase assembly factor CtaG